MHRRILEAEPQKRGRASREGRRALPWYRQAVLVLAGMLLLIGPAAPGSVFHTHAATISVTTCDKPSLDAAISSAQSGDTITFACSGTITDTLQITTTLTLDATGQNVIIDGNGLAGHVATIGAGGQLTLIDLTLTADNYLNATAIDGCIYNQGTVTLISSTISNCTALQTGFSDGGGIYNQGTLTLSNSTVTYDSARLYGGGIYNDNGTVVLTDSTVSGNFSDLGAGIENDYGTMTVTNSLVYGNGSFYSGGGILNAGTLTVINSTISTNFANNLGAGLFNGGGVVTLTNSTVSNNGTHAKPMVAGGIVNTNGGTVTIRNTIVADNYAWQYPDCLGVTSGGYNLVGIGDRCGLTNGENGDQVGTAASPLNPQLGPPQYNGGPTWTQALTFTSPAVDVVPLANLGNLTTDQRGQPRPDDGESLGDIGAYELQGTPPPTDTPSATPTSTSTDTSTPTGTSTATLTATVTSTGTPALPTVIATGTNTPAAATTGTTTPTSTPSPTQTPTNTSTPTSTATSTSTTTVSPTSTATAITSLLSPGGARTPPAALTKAALTLPKSARRTPLHGHKKTPLPRPRVPLSVNLALLAAPKTPLLSARIQTVPYARIHIVVQVVTTRTVVVGRGRTSRRATQTVIIYRVSTAGTADRHGQFTGHLRVSYAPRHTMPAQVIVTVSQGSTTASSALRLMIEPLRHPRSRSRG